MCQTHVPINTYTTQTRTSTTYQRDMYMTSWFVRWVCHQLREPLIIELFCGKWGIQIRHPTGLRHPVSMGYVHDISICEMSVQTTHTRCLCCTVAHTSCARRHRSKHVHHTHINTCATHAHQHMWTHAHHTSTHMQHRLTTHTPHSTYQCVTWHICAPNMNMRCIKNPWVRHIKQVGVWSMCHISISRGYLS